MGLVQELVVAEMTYILRQLARARPRTRAMAYRGDAHRRGAEGRQGVGYSKIDLAGVGLGGDVVAAGKAGFLAEDLVELVDLGGVVSKHFHKRGLSAGGALSTAESEAGPDIFDVVEVNDQILEPLGGAASKSDGLRGLVVARRPSAGSKFARLEMTHVKPSVGRSLYRHANLDRELMTLASLGRSKSSASRRKIRSALSVTWGRKGSEARRRGEVRARGYSCTHWARVSRRRKLAGHEHLTVA